MTLRTDVYPPLTRELTPEQRRILEWGESPYS